MQRHVGTTGGESPIHLQHPRRVGILQRNAIAGKPQPIEQLAMFARAGKHRFERGVGVSCVLRRIDRSAIDADANRTVVSVGHIGQEANLVLPGLTSIAVEQMARVIAYLIHKRRDVGHQPVVFLQVDRKIGVRASAADFGQRPAIAGRIDGHAHNLRAGPRPIVALARRLPRRRSSAWRTCSAPPPDGRRPS